MQSPAQAFSDALELLCKMELFIIVHLNLCLASHVYLKQRVLLELL